MNRRTLTALAEGLRLTADLRRAVSTVRDKEKADRLAELLSELHAQEVTR